MEKIINLFHGF